MPTTSTAAAIPVRPWALTLTPQKLISNFDMTQLSICNLGSCLSGGLRLLPPGFLVRQPSQLRVETCSNLPIRVYRGAYGSVRVRTVPKRVETSPHLFWGYPHLPEMG